LAAWICLSQGNSSASPSVRKRSHLIETTNGSVPTEKDVALWAHEYGNTDSPVVAGSRAMLQSGGGSWPLTGWPTFYYIDDEMVLRDIDRGYNAQEVIYSIDWLLTL